MSSIHIYLSFIRITTIRRNDPGNNNEKLKQIEFLAEEHVNYSETL